MKKNTRTTMVMMMVLGMTVSGAAGVFAGTNMEKITAYLDNSMGIQINGEVFTSTDNKGDQVKPIMYHGSAYLPVRALSNALDIPIMYDGVHNQIKIGSANGQEEEQKPEPEEKALTYVNYSYDQLNAIHEEFDKFESFEKAYAPMMMVDGDVYQKAVGTSDGVNFVFNHMTVNVSPRDYSYSYESTAIRLSNGVEAKWYKPDTVSMLSFKLDDRYVTLSSPDSSIDRAKLEQLAIGVSGLDDPINLMTVPYTATQQQTIKIEYAASTSFGNAYVPTKMINGDEYQSVSATEEEVNLVFSHMTVKVSAHDYSFIFKGDEIKLDNGRSAKWFKPSDTDMLGFMLDGQFVTISSPDHKWTRDQLEQVAVGIEKMN